MAMNDWQIGLVGHLDGTKSKQQLNNDINALKKQLNDVEIKAKLSQNQKQVIEQQLNNLQVQLNNVTVSPATLNGLVAQINNALSGIQIGNINVSNATSQAQQAGQQIGSAFSQGFSGQSANVIDRFTKSLGHVGKSSSEINSIVNTLKGLNVQIKDLKFSESTNGVMTVNVAGIDEFYNKVQITRTLVQDLQTMLWSTNNSTTSIVSTNELDRINNAFNDYTQKLAQFKSTNTNILSGLTAPLQDFETKLAGLKNGTATIDEVKNSFKLLGTEASKVTANFTGQLSKTDAAIRKLSQGDEIMDGLKASFKGLSNAPKDINTELNKVSKLLREVRNIESQEGRTVNWSAKYREWSDEVDRLKAKLSVLQKQQASMTTPQIFKTSDLRSADIPYMTKVSNTIEKQMAEIQKMANAKGWQNFEVKGIEKADGQIKSLTLTVREADGALKQFQMQRAKLQGSGKAQTGLMQVGDVKIIETASQAQAKLAQQTENANAKLQEQVNKIQLSFDDGTYEAKYDSLIAKTRQWVDANDESVISTQKLTQAYNEFNTAASNYAKDGSVANRDLLIQKEEELGRQLKATTNDIKIQNAEWAKSSKVDSFHQKVQEFYDKNSATHRRWGSQLKNILTETANGAQITTVRLNEIEQEFIEIGNQARQAGKLVDSFFGGLANQAKKFISWFSMTSVIMEGVQTVKKMVNEVKVLDNAMMDLTMATGYNRNQVEDLMDTYFKLGDQLSATASDVAASADTWLRQGKSIAETNKLIEDSMILSKIGGLSSEDSTKYLTSVMKGYKVATEDVIGVVDKLSAVDMASATDVGGLAEGMSEVAASADLAGVSMDKLLGYLATIGEVTQSGMGEVGTTLNAVFARMGNIKLSRLKDYETGEDLSNVETVLRGVDISLRDSTNSFRDFDEVLDETASNWNNYSEVQQRAIAQAFAGTHHMNEFIILMENYDTALKYTETSLGSTGQAMEKFEAYEESIAGHTEKFKNAFQDLSNSVIDSGLVNFFIDLGTTGIKAIDGLVDALGGLGTIGLLGGAGLSLKNVGISMLVAY